MSSWLFLPSLLSSSTVVFRASVCRSVLEQHSDLPVADMHLEMLLHHHWWFLCVCVFAKPFGWLIKSGKWCINVILYSLMVFGSFDTVFGHFNSYLWRIYKHWRTDLHLSTVFVSSSSHGIVEQTWALIMIMFFIYIETRVFRERWSHVCWISSLLLLILRLIDRTL